MDRVTGLLRACTGLIAWAAIFSLLYAVEGMGCANGWDAGVLRAALVAIWLTGVAGLAWLVWRWWPERGGALVEWMAGVIAIVGLISTIWTGFAVTILSACI